MNHRNFAQVLIVAVCVWVGPTGQGSVSAQDARNAVESLRSDLKADRNAVIAQEMSFTPQEGEAFWPIYRSYRAEVEKVSDRLVNLVFEYADLYPSVPDAKAAEMLKTYTKVETDLLSVKKKYLKKMGKVLPASKVLLFAQLDNRLDLGMRVALAASLPIVPTTQAQAGSQPH